MNKYRFNEEPNEYGKPQHLHQLYSERKGQWENLTGTTTILEVLGKNLTWWSAELSAVECLEAGEKIPTIREEYLKACESGNKKVAIDALQKKYPIFKKARFAHYDSKNQKAEEGTDLHETLEQFVKYGERAKIDWEDPRIKAFVKWTLENVKQFIGSEVHVYEELLFIGGIIDCIAELNDGTIAIIDFKSAKEAYFNHFAQCALYDIQLSCNGAFDKNGNLLFKLEKPISQYIVVPFGAKELKPAVYKNINSLKRAANHCVGLYREKGFFDNR